VTDAKPESPQLNDEAQRPADGSRGRPAQEEDAGTLRRVEIAMAVLIVSLLIAMLWALPGT